ncbi:MAG: hypothetical protein HGB02_03885 [Chlorobiaceae bacterium]|nr:hypothetical protein [Chlorobiaceae bacterium]
MPTIPYETTPELEYGTIAEVTAILRQRGETIGYRAVQKRITRMSHYETFKLAMQVSRRLREERQERAAQFRSLIEQAKREGIA